MFEALEFDQLAINLCVFCDSCVTSCNSYFTKTIHDLDYHLDFYEKIGMVVNKKLFASMLLKREGVNRI